MDIDGDPEKAVHFPFQLRGKPPGEVAAFVLELVRRPGTAIDRIEWRWSPSGLGIHVRVRFRNYLNGSQVLRWRSQAGDDPRRVYYDMQRAQEHPENLGGFLNEVKAPKKDKRPRRCGAWIPVPL